MDREHSTSLGRGMRSERRGAPQWPSLPGFVRAGLTLAVLGALIRSGASMQLWMTTRAEVERLVASDQFGPAVPGGQGQQLVVAVASLGHLVLAVGLFVLGAGFLLRGFAGDAREGTERGLFALAGALFVIASLIPSMLH
jgi:hypothetical protein